MKRLFFIITMSMFLFGCSQRESVTTNPDTNTESDTNTNSETTSEQEKVSIIWTEQESKNRIVVGFHDTTEWSRQEQDFLEGMVESWLSEYTGETIELVITENGDQQESAQTEGYTIDLTGETTYRSDSLTSVIFQGMIQYKQAAHPNHVFFSINFDPRNLEIVPFEALYTIDAELYQAFAREGERNILEESDGEWPENFGEFSEVFCSQEDFIKGLQEDSPQWECVYYYYTEDGVGFSYSVVHALGGHKEVELLRTDQNVSIYKDILDDYDSIIAFRLSEGSASEWNSGDFVKMSDSMTAALLDKEGERSTGGLSLDVKWSYMIGEMTKGLDSPSVSDFEYVLRDVNGDDVPELFWVRSDDMILAVFAQREGQVVLLDAFWPRYRCVLTDAGELYTRGSGGAGINHYEIRKITTDAKLLLVKSFGMEGTHAAEYYEILGGRKISISEERFEELLEEFPFNRNSETTQITVDFKEIIAYSDEQLLEIAGLEVTKDELMVQYPTTYTRTVSIVQNDISNATSADEVSYRGETKVLRLMFDGVSGDKIFSYSYNTFCSKKEFETLAIGQLLSDVQMIDPDGEYLFLYTGRNDVPRISTHYTTDGFVVSIIYDKNNVIEKIDIVPM